MEAKLKSPGLAQAAEHVTCNVDAVGYTLLAGTIFAPSDGIQARVF